MLSVIFAVLEVSFWALTTVVKLMGSLGSKTLSSDLRHSRGCRWSWLGGPQFRTPGPPTWRGFHAEFLYCQWVFGSNPLALCHITKTLAWQRSGKMLHYVTVPLPMLLCHFYVICKFVLILWLAVSFMPVHVDCSAMIICQRCIRNCF